MGAGWPQCHEMIEKCQNDTSTCAEAQKICEVMMMAPYTMSGMNPYDIRLKCEKEPLCYDCNNTVNAMFASDWMKNFDRQVVDLLEGGVKVLIYAGDMDFICNWIGNKAWTLALDWSGKAAFNAAKVR